MSKRISHSLLDPYIIPHIPKLYRVLAIPRWFPPEGIVFLGHLLAIVGAVGFAYTVKNWWCGIIAVIGVAGNHFADMLDGTHARQTGQCRNSGELLDHFVDPLSFCYWIIGIAISCDRPFLGLIAIMAIYATAVLTNIKAKMIGEFTLAAFGSTEFKCLLIIYGLAIVVVGASSHLSLGPGAMAIGFLWISAAIGVIQLVINLVLALREVDMKGPEPDTENWKLKKPMAR